MPAAPAPTMQTGASSTVPPGTERASMIIAGQMRR
jgi:hypothetical protein